jgi:hypothetical protein
VSNNWTTMLGECLEIEQAQHNVFVARKVAVVTANKSLPCTFAPKINAHSI